MDVDDIEEDEGLEGEEETDVRKARMEENTNELV